MSKLAQDKGCQTIEVQELRRQWRIATLAIRVRQPRNFNEGERLDRYQFWMTHANAKDAAKTMLQLRKIIPQEFKC